MSIIECSASEHIEQIKQPRVVYINPKTLEVEPFDDGGRDVGALDPVENISPWLVETVVSSMTLFMSGTPKEEAFSIPGIEARCFMDGIRGLNDNSIINAVKLFGLIDDRGESVGSIDPDEVTIQNVKTMVERSFRFLNGPSGSFWGLETSEVCPTKDDIYQLIMRCLTELPTEFRSARSARSRQCYLGIYNPRLNEVYLTRVDAIPDDVITEVEKGVLNYSARTTGCSVTRRLKQIKQPRGGYINPRTLEVVSLGDGIDALNSEENVSPGLIGIAVDYLTRFMLGTPVEEAFEISMLGARLIGEDNEVWFLMEDVKGLDDESIISAVKLSGFDVCLRAGPMHYRSFEGINPDEATIQNVRTMVERALHFFDEYGPMVLNGFTFEGGYTDIVSSGDGDFTTVDTLWDFKVSKARPTKNHTLQLLMYWRMGLRSIHAEFQNVKYLGIYNPRLNEVYRISVDDIPRDVITEVDRDVIGYPVHQL